MRSTFSVLSNCMKSASVIPKNVIITIETDSGCFPSARDHLLYPFLENDLQAGKIYIKLRCIDSKNCGYIQRFLKLNMVASIEYEELTNYDSPAYFLVPYTQNDVLRIAKFPTDRPQRNVQEIAKMWLENQSRESCKIHVSSIYIQSIQFVIAEIERQNPTIGVSCKPSKGRKNVYVITVPGCEKQMIVNWQVEVENSSKKGFRLDRIVLEK